MRRGDSVAEVNGEVQFLWRPSPWLRYVCTFEGGIPEALDPLVPGDPVLELVDGLEVPYGRLRDATDPHIVSTGASGHSVGPLPPGLTLGSAASVVQSAQFHLVNGPNVVGPRPVARAEGGRYRGRLRLVGRHWKATLDVRPDVDLNTYVRELLEQRAFGPTHIGLLERTKGENFDIESAHDGLALLFTMLSFCRGALTGPSLPVGIDDTGSALAESRDDAC